MNVVNKLLGLVGLNLRRTSYETGSREGLSVGAQVNIRIGGRELVIPSTSALAAIYREIPDYMAELARISKAVYSKYASMLAVDVGANVGDTASIIRSGCPAPIICFEGDPAHATLLAENASRIGQVDIRGQYLSEVSRTERVSVAKSGSNATLLPAAGDESAALVEFLTLDDALRDTDRRRVKLLKVDTEGFDSRVLRGARATLDEGRPAILFEHNRENLSAIGEDNLSAFTQLREAGYGTVLFWDAYGRFVLATSLERVDNIADLHGYVGFLDTHLSKAIYLDVCAFHRDDQDLADRCVLTERNERSGNVARRIVQ